MFSVFTLFYLILENFQLMWENFVFLVIFETFDVDPFLYCQSLYLKIYMGISNKFYQRNLEFFADFHGTEKSKKMANNFSLFTRKWEKVSTLEIIRILFIFDLVYVAFVLMLSKQYYKMIVIYICVNVILFYLYCCI